MNINENSLLLGKNNLKPNYSLLYDLKFYKNQNDIMIDQNYARLTIHYIIGIISPVKNRVNFRLCVNNKPIQFIVAYDNNTLIKTYYMRDLKKGDRISIKSLDKCYFEVSYMLQEMEYK